MGDNGARAQRRPARSARWRRRRVLDNPQGPLIPWRSLWGHLSPRSAHIPTRPHAFGANPYLLVEVVGAVEERARYYKVLIASAELSSAVIDAGGDAIDAQGAPEAGVAKVPRSTGSASAS